MLGPSGPLGIRFHLVLLIALRPNVAQRLCQEDCSGLHSR